jgi:hypothetical protein
MTNEEEPLVNQDYLLQKFPGKGGWTYAEIPEILQDKRAPFGWVKVKGSIDGYQFKNYRLMPMGNGNLFLPVKAEIRKKIHKREGDVVRVILYPDSTLAEIPEELLICLKDEPGALDNFNRLKPGEQKDYIDWIYSAKKDDTKVDRLARTIDKVLKGEKLYEMRKKP